MKLTKSRLIQIINEEIKKIEEGDPPCPGEEGVCLDPGGDPPQPPPPKKPKQVKQPKDGQPSYPHPEGHSSPKPKSNESLQRLVQEELENLLDEIELDEQ